MAKTNLIDGSKIMSDFANALYGGAAVGVWAAETAYVVGNMVIKTGVNYRCIVAGTSAAFEPTWPSTVRSTVVDGTVTWEKFEGHQHDGKAMDGSSSKILLTGGAEVQGVLPLANSGLALPIGSIIPYYGTTAPSDDYLVCDGSTFNATTYAALNTLLGGNNLPNLKGKFLVGYDATDSDYNAIGKTGGQKNMPQHSHDISSGTFYYSYGGSSTGKRFEDTTQGDMTSALTANAGTGLLADDNRPPFAAVNYLIVAK